MATQYVSGATRLEHDLLGEREIPEEYFYGIQTSRAIDNFNISNEKLSSYPPLIEGLAMVKEAARANEVRCREQVMNSIGLVTALNPVLGYEVSTRVAKTALASGRGVYEIVLEEGLLSQDELDEILLPENMIKPKRYQRKQAQ